MKLSQKLAVLVIVAMAGSSAMAAGTGIDVSAVTSGISDAQTAILAVLTALLAMSTAIFGLAKVYAFVKRRAGA